MYVCVCVWGGDKMNEWKKKAGYWNMLILKNY